MSALELIEREYRFTRYLSLSKLRRQLNREKGHCTWCDGKTPNNRMRWCTADCRSEGYIRAGFIQGPVRDRDKGVCGICNKSTRSDGKYEIDHIIPVIEGGGCCGLDNLRTTCIPCHRKETKELAGRRAAQKRDEKLLLFV